MSRVRAQRPRRGVILAVVLVVLLCAMLFGTALVRHLVLHRQRGEMNRDQQQALWLAESGVMLASERVATSSEYQGERWRVGLGPDGEATGEVQIQVTPVEGALRRIEVVAAYSRGGVQVSSRREILFNLKENGANR